MIRTEQGPLVTKPATHDPSSGRFITRDPVASVGRRLHRAKPVPAPSVRKPAAVPVRRARAAAIVVVAPLPSSSASVPASLPPSAPPSAPAVTVLSVAAFNALLTDFRGTRTALVSPALAIRILELNTGNRRINRTRVAEYVTTMTEGLFFNTGEPIIVSDAKILNDGQNRLQAVVESNVTVEMDIRFGVPREFFTVTNSGQTRTAADVLSIRGVHAAPTVAATVRLLLAHSAGLPDHLRDRFDNQDVDRAFASWPELSRAFELVSAASVPAQFRGTPLYAAVSLALREPGHERLPEWLACLATGLGAERDDPAHQLRERLLRPARDTSNGRDRQLVRFALMLKSWALFREGRTVPMREFRWARGGRRPFPSLAAIDASMA